MKRIYVVTDKIISDADSWEAHVPSLLQGYVEASNLTNVSVVEVTDLETLKSIFQKEEITVNDKIVFTNAWSSMTIYCKHWSENYQIPVEMIGFWTRGCYINQDSEFRPMNDRNWRKVHERANFRCLNKSFFISEFHKEQFRIYVSKFVFPNRLNIIKFPLDYLSLEMMSHKEDYFKQDMIIFPWNKYTELHEQIMYDFIRVFKDVQIIFAQERVPLERYQLRSQLSKAKIAFLPYDAPNIGKEIYECVLLGTIPLVPDIEGLRELVPEEFRYPVEWTQSIFNYCKFAPDLTAKIKNLIADYKIHADTLKQHQDYLYEYFYDSEPFIKEIFGNTNKN